MKNLFFRKKMDKQTLDQIAETMPVLSEKEARACVGRYKDDCFWRCVVFLEKGGLVTEQDAENRIAQYIAELPTGNVVVPIGGEGMGTFADRSGSFHENLRKGGAGMTFSQIREFLKHEIQQQRYSNRSNGYYIGVFKHSDMSGNSGDAGGHAIVVLGHQADGSINYYDPQLNVTGIIEASKAQYVSRAF